MLIKANPNKPNLVRHLVRRSPLINPCGTKTEALAKADSNPTTDSTVLIKLWYWITNNKLNVLKELKQLQLQIAELAGKGPPSER
jgi:hypothetical protein